MANVTCRSCGRRYDYSQYDCCPECGSLNSTTKQEDDVRQTDPADQDCTDLKQSGAEESMYVSPSGKKGPNKAGKALLGMFLTGLAMIIVGALFKDDAFARLLIIFGMALLVLFAVGVGSASVMKELNVEKPMGSVSVLLFCGFALGFVLLLLCVLIEGSNPIAAQVRGLVVIQAFVLMFFGFWGFAFFYTVEQQKRVNGHVKLEPGEKLGFGCAAIFLPAFSILALTETVDLVREVKQSANPAAGIVWVVVSLLLWALVIGILAFVLRAIIHALSDDES